MLENNNIESMDYAGLTAKASQIQQKRATLKAQIDTSEAQLASIEQELVSKYGADYQKKFDADVKAIADWENANAGSVI